MQPIQIPAGWVAAGQGMPNVCARHGRPAVERARIRLISKPPSWTYGLVFLGGIVFAIVTMALRKTVWAPAWPFCDQCRAKRTQMMAIGLGIVTLGVLSLAGTIALISANPDNPAIGLGLLASILVLLAALVVLARSKRVFLAGANVSEDGQWVIVRAEYRFVQAAYVVPAGYSQQPGYGQLPPGQPGYGQQSGYVQPSRVGQLPYPNVGRPGQPPYGR
jgi:hypothetical protein